MRRPFSLAFRWNEILPTESLREFTMNNACPECAAIYSVSEKDIGRRIACKRCGTPLIVGTEGLKRESDDAAKVPPLVDEPRRERDRDEDRDRRRDRDDSPRDRDRDRGRERDWDAPRGERRGPDLGAIWTKFKSLGDVSTWLYGIGLFFVIHSFFSAKIDEGKLKSRQADLDLADLEDKRKDREDKRKNDGSQTENGRKARKNFNEETRPPLEDDVSRAKIDAQNSVWWASIFRLWGFILLSFGSLGYMSPQQSQLKRIVGGATLLLILMQVIGGGLNFGVEFQGGKN